MPDRRYWDDTAFVAGLSDTRSASAEVLRACAEGGILINTSALTLLTVFEDSMDASTHKLLDFMRRSFVKLIDVDRTAAENARDYAAEYLISLEDAVHLWSAVRSKAKLLETTRESLLALDGRVPNLKIRRPEVEWPPVSRDSMPSLFDTEPGDSDSASTASPDA